MSNLQTIQPVGVHALGCAHQPIGAVPYKRLLSGNGMLEEAKAKRLSYIEFMRLRVTSVLQGLSPPGQITVEWIMKGVYQSIIYHPVFPCNEQVCPPKSPNCYSGGLNLAAPNKQSQLLTTNHVVRIYGTYLHTLT